MSDPTHCKSCGAKIVWRQHLVTGKLAPIDAEPSPDGNIFIGSREYWLIPKEDRAEPAREGKLHTNHFSTCPQAKGWKR